MEAELALDEIGYYHYTVEGWVDHFASWHRDLKKRVEAGQNIANDLLIGAQLVASAMARAAGKDGTVLAGWAAKLREASPSGSIAIDSLDPLAGGDGSVSRPGARDAVTSRNWESSSIGGRAQFSTWYELFPRSTSKVPGSTDFCRLHRSVALRCRDGLRRPLFAADSPDRANLPQRTQQRADGWARRTGKPLGNRRGGGGHKRSCPSWVRWPISSG